jgi:hypothetical protein
LALTVPRARWPVRAPKCTSRGRWSRRRPRLRAGRRRPLALFPASLAERNARPQLTWRPVDDAPQATFAVAWPQRSRSLAVTSFVRAD